jgi:hypothetical protein
MLGGRMTLQRGDLVPHFNVTTVQGSRFEYSTIWQNRNLVLITLPASDSASSREYGRQFGAEVASFRQHNTECVVSRDVVRGIASPSVVVADRWGEIVHVATGADIAGLPSPSELFDWIEYLERQCPECQGETK